MPRAMVHPRLKRILSESSSAVSSPPDTTSDAGKPEPESEEQDPELESVAPSKSDAEQRKLAGAGIESESPGSKMDISDDDPDGAPKREEEDRTAPDADASSDTQKPTEGTPSRMNTSPQDTSTPLPPHDEALPPESTAPSARDDSPVAPKSVSRSPSPHSTKDVSSVPPSASVSANRSPSPQSRPSLKIKLKLGARPSQIASEAETSEEKPRGRRGRGRGKAPPLSMMTRTKASAPAPLTFTLPARSRTDASEASSHPSGSRSQSSHHSSAESEDDAEDADAESDNEDEAQNGREEHAEPNDIAMDVDIPAPSLLDRLDDDVESEGDVAEDDYDAAGDEDNEVLPGGRKSRLTARQAVLASMVGADHVELETATSSRKKQLTSEEIALRREETARKRKNMSEKKLEDEKTETINRLLKKQSSRSRAKRSALLSSVVPTPQSPHSGDEVESDAIAGAGSGPTEQKSINIPGPTWRWVSNRTGIRLGVPNEALMETDGVEMEIDAVDSAREMPVGPKPPAVCDVSGCGKRRKYRLVHDFERGACGMEHLNVLIAAA